MVKNEYAGKRRAFCEEHFKLTGLRWYDRVGLKPLARDRVARVELSTRTGEDTATIGSYVCLDVRVVHRINGEIDRKTFVFADYLHDRSDDRRDHPDIRPYVSENRDVFDWYIAVPSIGARQHLMDAVGDYITTWEGKVH